LTPQSDGIDFSFKLKYWRQTAPLEKRGAAKKNKNKNKIE